MNYFELFGIKPHIFIETKALKRKYFELSKLYHPDRISGTANDTDILLNAAKVNMAWETFSNVDKTLKYLLANEQLIEDNEKYALDNAFLMEIMECKEQLMEAEMDEDLVAKEKAILALENIKNELDIELNACNEKLLNGLFEQKDKAILKAIYYKRKYVNSAIG